MNIHCDEDNLFIRPDLLEKHKLYKVFCGKQGIV